MKSPSADPYFFFNALLELKNKHSELSEQQIAQLKQQIILNAADPTAAVEFVDLAGDDWAHIYPPEPDPEPITTNSAIDTFLENYGSRNPKEDALLERLIFNPTPDYSQVLEKENSSDPAPASPASEQDALIAAFINQSADAPQQSATDEDDILAAIEQKPADAPPLQPIDDQPQTIAPDAQPAKPGGSLSESLAKIYIKQGRYERAFEIISDLNLNYPEKSVYFADQLRFLQKLIDLQKARNSKSRSSQ
jgi:hypothetical protein